MTPRRRERSRERPQAPHGGPAAGAQRLLDAAVIVAAAYFLLAYLWVALTRLAYPFELEWLEGQSLEQVRRILAGLPIYVAPSLTFVPSNYTPLYFVVAAGSAALLGADFLALRLVSFLASLLCFALLYALVRRETRHWKAAFLSVGLFAATYRLSGAWLDIARADSLYLAFLLAGVCVLRLDPTRVRAPLAAGTLFALAFLTKQSAPVVLAPLVIWLCVVDLRRGLTTAATMAGLAGGAAVLLDVLHGGWFRYYAFDVARRHPMDPGLLWMFPVHDLARPLGIAVLVVIVAVARRVSRPAADVLGFHGALLAGLLASSWQLRLYRGGYENVLLTATLGVALATGIAWGSLTLPAGEGRPTSRWAAGLTLALLLQFGLLWWNPRSQVPSEADRAAGERLVRQLHAVSGRVFVSSHSYLTERSGKPPHVHVMPFMDVVKGAQGPVESALLQSLRDTLAAHVYPVLVMDTRDWLLEEALRAGYQARARVFTTEDGFWPVTGMRTRPEYVLTVPGSRDSLP
jgi:4-amino-4-deoxy-L-arabinose transferase-like glycosyltransferase